MERRLRSLAAVCFAFVSTAVSSASAQSAPEQPSEPAEAQPSGAQPPAAEATPAPANEWANVKFGATFEGYYQYNWNRPPDRTLVLRAYDTRSNIFSIQQAALVVDAAPDVDAGRRYGLRVDLQFGQATETVQGGAANEPRPDVYRHSGRPTARTSFRLAPAGCRPTSASSRRSSATKPTTPRTTRRSRAPTCSTSCRSITRACG